MAGVLIKKKKKRGGGEFGQIHTNGEHRVNTKAWIGVMLLQLAKDRQRTTKARGEAGDRVSFAALGRTHACQHLNRGFLVSKTVRRYVSVV